MIFTVQYTPTPWVYEILALNHQRSGPFGRCVGDCAVKTYQDGKNHKGKKSIISAGGPLRQAGPNNLYGSGRHLSSPGIVQRQAVGMTRQLLLQLRCRSTSISRRLLPADKRELGCARRDEGLRCPAHRLRRRRRRALRRLLWWRLFIDGGGGERDSPRRDLLALVLPPMLRAMLLLIVALHRPQHRLLLRPHGMPRHGAAERWRTSRPAATATATACCCSARR